MTLSAMFVKLIAITNEGRDALKQHGEIWFVMDRTDHVRFSSTPGPWLFVQAHGDRRWVHETRDSDFNVEPYGRGLDEAATEELRIRIIGDRSEPSSARSRLRWVEGRTLLVGGLSLGAFMVAGLSARNFGETLGPCVLLAVLALFGAVHQYGRWSEGQRVLHNAEEAVRRKVVAKSIRRFQNRIESFYTREGQSKVIHLDARLFIGMKDLVCVVYKTADELDDDTASILRDFALGDSEWIGGVPLDRVRAWLRSWDSICHGSIERAENIQAVHLCDHGCLFLDDGRTIRRSDLKDSCTEFTESFVVVGATDSVGPSGRG